MFVVKRPFKSFGKAYTAGDVIDNPAAIKRFKGKLAEGKIIEVTEQTYNTHATYFKDKYGVSLPSLKEPDVEATKATTNPTAFKPSTESVKSSTVKVASTKTPK